MDTVLQISVGASASAAQFSWASLLGQRMVQKVSFTINGNPLDEYQTDVQNFHYHFFITPNKRPGWNRMMGQENPTTGYLPVDSTGTITQREVRAVVNGLQTPKLAHDAFTLYVPLLFWFNLDPRLAIPSVAIPYGQRFINVTLDSLTNLARTTTGAAVVFTTTPTITDMNIYINNIFVNKEIHDIYIARIGFNLIRVHRYQVTRLTKTTDEILLQQIKWPIETMYIGFRPTSSTNLAAAPNRVMQRWYTYSAYSSQAVRLTRATQPPAVAATEYPSVDFDQCQNSVSRITLTAHGIPLYNDIPVEFFSSYQPYTYGQQHINTPEDCGALMLNFCLYPGSYQPSGHLNISQQNLLLKKSESNIRRTADNRQLHMHADELSSICNMVNSVNCLVKLQITVI